jgi:hypothetical protein
MLFLIKISYTKKTCMTWETSVLSQMMLVSYFQTDQKWAMDVYPLKVGLQPNYFLLSELIRSIGWVA